MRRKSFYSAYADSLRYSLSYRDLEEMMREHGLAVDHTTIYRWAQHYAPELDKRSRPHMKACNDSWRVDETYIKVKKVWMYLYRAVDSEGTTLEFFLSPTRDAEAAKRFFLKVLPSTAGTAPGARPSEEPMAQSTAVADSTPTTSIPRVINVDKNAAYPKAFNELQAEGIIADSCELTSASSISTTSSSKTTVSSNGSSSQGCASFPSKQQSERVPRYEVMNMIRKGDIKDQVRFIASLFGVAA